MSVRLQQFKSVSIYPLPLHSMRFLLPQSYGLQAQSLPICHLCIIHAFSQSFFYRSANFLACIQALLNHFSTARPTSLPALKRCSIIFLLLGQILCLH
jgi:hypothetical protein